ncbi:MAG: hypothetical protein U9O41_02090 [Candidatus Aerophobetes bacterium]|nr:hypothetical protein [Candidatus Aerophobetes bacterium]
MNKVFFLSLLLLLFLLASTTFAHQPRIVSGELTQIENPEVSQAFYGELQGKPGYFQITSGERFRLYVGILVPDLEGIGKDVSVEITRKHEHGEEEPSHKHEKGKTHFVLNGVDHQ